MFFFHSYVSSVTRKVRRKAQKEDPTKSIAAGRLKKDRKERVSFSKKRAANKRIAALSPVY
jgi:hypothetical protein